MRSIVGGIKVETENEFRNALIRVIQNESGKAWLRYNLGTTQEMLQARTIQALLQARERLIGVVGQTQQVVDYIEQDDKEKREERQKMLQWMQTIREEVGSVVALVKSGALDINHPDVRKQSSKLNEQIIWLYKVNMVASRYNYPRQDSDHRKQYVNDWQIGFNVLFTLNPSALSILKSRIYSSIMLTTSYQMITPIFPNLQ